MAGSSILTSLPPDWEQFPIRRETLVPAVHDVFAVFKQMILVDLINVGQLRPLRILTEVLLVHLVGKRVFGEFDLNDELLHGFVNGNAVHSFDGIRAQQAVCRVLQMPPLDFCEQ
jgi:hypothetical protein